MNVILIGPRGVGKSKVSRTLSKLIDYPVISTDSIIVYENGGLPIPKFIEKAGWNQFRDLEYFILKKLENADGIIVDCGGGIIFDLDQDGNEILSERKLSLLKKMGKLILLERDFRDLIEKVSGDQTRPDLIKSKPYSEILKKRIPYYQAASDHKLSVGGHTKEEISERISMLLGFKK